MAKKKKEYESGFIAVDMLSFDEHLEQYEKEYPTMEHFLNDISHVCWLSRQVYIPILDIQSRIALDRGCEDVFQYAWAGLDTLTQTLHPEALLPSVIKRMRDLEEFALLLSPHEREQGHKFVLLVLALMYALCQTHCDCDPACNVKIVGRLLAQRKELQEHIKYIDAELARQREEWCEDVPTDVDNTPAEKKERFKYINKSMSEEEQEEVEKKIQAWVKNEENGAAKVLANYFMREREQIAKDKELTLSGYETAKVLYDELAAHFKGCAFACSTWQRHYSARKK